MNQDQMTHNAVSDKGLHCLLSGLTVLLDFLI